MLPSLTVVLQYVITPDKTKFHRFYFEFEIIFFEWQSTPILTISPLSVLVPAHGIPDHDYWINEFWEKKMDLIKKRTSPLKRSPFLKESRVLYLGSFPTETGTNSVPWWLRFIYPLTLTGPDPVHQGYTYPKPCTLVIFTLHFSTTSPLLILTDQIPLVDYSTSLRFWVFRQTGVQMTVKKEYGLVWESQRTLVVEERRRDVGKGIGSAVNKEGTRSDMKLSTMKEVWLGNIRDDDVIRRIYR